MVASKFGADSSLLMSPVNTKLGCCKLPAVPVTPVELELLKPDEDEAPAVDEDLNSIHGTATCLPPTLDVVEPSPVLAEVELEVVPEVELLFAAPVALVRDRIAKSTRPEAGLIIVSLIVPISLPDDPVT